MHGVCAVHSVWGELGLLYMFFGEQDAFEILYLGRVKCTYKSYEVHIVWGRQIVCTLLRE